MTTTASVDSAAAKTDRRRWWALGVIGLAQLLVIVDSTIVNIALPSAQRDLGMSDSARQWTISAYTLAFGGLLLLGGRLADRFGRKNTLLIGITGFALASAVGGAANGTGMLLAARAAQGVFAALLAPSTISLLALTFTDPRERGKAFGVFGSILMSGAAVGLVLGGFLAQYLDWRWCLYVNLPLAALAGVAGWKVLPSVPGHRDTKLDWLSAILGSVGIVSFVYALSEAATRGWGSRVVLGCLVGAAVLLVLFAVRQGRAGTPLLPPAVVLDRNRAGAYATAAAAAFGMFGTALFMTYQLQVIMHFGALEAGVSFLPTLAANVLCSTQLGPRLLPRVGPKPLLVGGLVVLALAMLLLTRLTPSSSYFGLIMPAQVLLGLGSGLAMPTVMHVATAGVESRDAGAASAFITTSQQVGASTGTASLNTIAAGTTASSAGLGATAATVHGFATASGWAAGVLAAAAAGVSMLVAGVR